MSSSSIPLISNLNSLELLSGGGEMGQLLRSYDWSNTSVGPVQLWPQSLLTTLSIVINSQFPMFLWWGNDLIQFYNDAYRPSLGNSGKHPSALGQKAYECWPEIWHIIKPLIDQVMNGGPSVWSDDQLIPIYRNGQLEDVYWTFSYSAVKIENGEIGGVLVVCNENTGKVINLKKLQESEDQLRFAIEATELGTFDFNPVTQKFKSNNRLKEWFGLPADSEIDLSVALQSIREQDRERVLNALQTALQYTYGGFYNIEHTIINPHTRQERIIKAKGRVWFNEKQLPYRFNGTIQDITEQVAAIQKMQAAELLARSTAERLQLALDAGKLGSYELTVKTGEITCNSQCKYNFGLLEEEVFNLEKFMALIIPEDQALVKDAIQSGIDNHKLYNAEYRILLPDKRIRWIKIFGKPVYDELDLPLKIIGVTVDISEQKVFAEELRKQVKERTLELHRSNEDLLQFAHVTSHDLKEPVRKVKTYTDRLNEECGTELSEKGKLYLNKIEQATNRMYAMIEGVLSYSSLNATDQIINPIDLNEIISNIETDIEILIHQKKGSIHKKSLPSIEGASVLIYQLFYNLITNSFKFSRKNFPVVVSITSSIIKNNETEFVKINIRDNGIGFDKKHIPTLFNAFTRLNSKDKYEGTGLGLALCKKIVERHGGSIVADGKENEGAVFTVILPLKQSQQFI